MNLATPFTWDAGNNFVRCNCAKNRHPNRTARTLVRKLENPCSWKRALLYRSSGAREVKKQQQQQQQQQRTTTTTTTNERHKTQNERAKNELKKAKFSIALSHCVVVPFFRLC
jgi:hypothetical protein